jgi:hypothetical protein
MNQAAQLPRNPASRSLGIALVAVVHVVAFLAISQGLMQKIMPKPPGPIVARTIPEEPPKPEPVRRLESVPKLEQPRYVPLPIPDPPLTAPPSDTPPRYAEHTEAPPADMGVREVTPPQGRAASSSGLQSAGAVCTQQRTPEAPTVNWSGVALFHVVASTHAGRVTEVEIRSPRGDMDARSLRAFKSAIETALREGYVCPGEVRFDQEFQFRVE